MAGQWDELMDEADALLGWATGYGDAATRVIADGSRMTVRLERGERTGPLEGLAAAAREVGFPPMSYAAIAAEAAFDDAGPERAPRVARHLAAPGGRAADRGDRRDPRDGGVAAGIGASGRATGGFFCSRLAPVPQRPVGPHGS